jgi:predicted lysophospholipase L1 biosynthesis ABC-type transport system permease subunit
MLMIASQPGTDPATAVKSIKGIRPDLAAVTTEELVARLQQVEFSYFRQMSFVLAAITMFFGILLITVLLSVSTNQRLGEIAALRALGFSQYCWLKLRPPPKITGKKIPGTLATMLSRCALLNVF